MSKKPKPSKRARPAPSSRRPKKAASTARSKRAPARQGSARPPRASAAPVKAEGTPAASAPSTPNATRRATKPTGDRPRRRRRRRAPDSAAAEPSAPRPSTGPAHDPLELDEGTPESAALELDDEPLPPRRARESDPAASEPELSARDSDPPDSSALTADDAGDSDAPWEEEAPELGIGSRVVAPNLRFEPDPREFEPPRSEPPRRTESSPDVEAQIRALEARLDGLIRRAVVPSEEEAPAPSAAPEAADDGAPPSPAEPRAEAAEVLPQPAPADYVERQWGREALRSRFEEIDDFGLDPEFERKVRPALELLYRRYFRAQVEGIEHVPASGRAVVIANHGGALPLDGAMLRTALRLDHPNKRDLRWLAEDFVFYLPFAGVFLNRIGAVRACPENAERLLEKDAVIAVFPEGVHGIKKLFSQRYRLQRFGRGGYIRLCLRARAPLVPCAIIGAEETNPLLYRLESLAELFKLPYLPVTPTFPLLGPVGLLPAPTRWKLRFGEPISFDNYGPEAADDHVLVGRLSERVRAAIQGLLDTGLRDRKSVWFG